MTHITIFFFFFNDTATTEIYTLSLHDALPISHLADAARVVGDGAVSVHGHGDAHGGEQDRKSTRLNSSHGYISYAVFCLKKKKNRRECEPIANFHSEVRACNEGSVVGKHVYQI